MKMEEKGTTKIQTKVPRMELETKMEPFKRSSQHKRRTKSEMELNGESMELETQEKKCQNSAGERACSGERKKCK